MALIFINQIYTCSWSYNPLGLFWHNFWAVKVKVSEEKRKYSIQYCSYMPILKRPLKQSICKLAWIYMFYSKITWIKYALVSLYVHMESYKPDLRISVNRIGLSDKTTYLIFRFVCKFWTFSLIFISIHSWILINLYILFKVYVFNFFYLWHSSVP